MGRAWGPSAVTLVVAVVSFGVGCGSGAGPAAVVAPIEGRLAAGAGHTCVVEHAGAVSCWGSNADGQLGDGTEIDSPRPGPVSGLSGAAQLAAGSYHTCALTAAGTVSCWGWNVGGQIGDGTNTNRLAAFQVPALPTVAAVAAGSYHSCGL